ncbi:MAG TPA: 4Fe-4S dicluster domain-containing protein [Methanothermococcus okinawensis]|uniref:4Fe-4S dicluster domain-containing protein n=1 Tax=Methanothermococcus okinawensis TaxID=155863 RepID=A0A833EAS5_9EURY|nr:4Fe-4S dicluster domain-containing protein [Methanothermococcus okinawensis]
MASTLWYLYILTKKRFIKRFLWAKTDREYTIPPKRFRKIPPVVEYPERCISCGACEGSCPSSAIEMVYFQDHNKKLPRIDVGACIGCGNCVESCPTKVLEIGNLREETLSLPWNVPKYRYFVIDQELCVNCGSCKGVCPVDAIDYDGDSYRIDVNRCIGCERCVEACPVLDAIRIYDEEVLKEKFNRCFEIKFKRMVKEEERGEVIPEVPRIVRSLCIRCGNCVDVCPGEIDLKDYKVVECTRCGRCIEVCPTGAMRIGEVSRVSKIKDRCYIIEEDRCIGCRICYRVCSVGAIDISWDTRLPYINPEKCVRCGVCYRECPVEAISLTDTESSLKLYRLRKVRDYFESMVSKDLDEISRKYVQLKSDLLEFAQGKVEEALKRIVDEKMKKDDSNAL